MRGSNSQGVTAAVIHLSGLDVVTPALDASGISHPENSVRIVALPSAK